MTAIVGRGSVSAVALASAWLVLAGPAWATSSGSSGTGGDGGTGSEGSSGTTSSDGSTTADATTSGSTSVADGTGGCDHCSPNAGKITFVSPKDGDDVTAPFVAVVEIDDSCTCDGCVCSPDPPMYAQIFLDTLGVDVPCYASPCEFEVFPTLGTHTVMASARFSDWTNTTKIEVHVTAIDAGTSEGGGPGPTTDPTAAGESTGTGPAEQGGGGGCGCTADSRERGAAWLALGLLVLGARRRPRA